MEKGVRADLFGSNPHSKGVIFSRSFFDVFEIILHIIIIIIDKITAKIIEIIIKKITFS